MRIFSNCRELLSEIMRDVSEQGTIVHPQTMQNQRVADNEEFQTKELLNYSYCLTSRADQENLFISNPKQNFYWCKSEFSERISRSWVNPGKAWLIRKDTWEPFLSKAGEFCYTYNERLNRYHNLEKIIDELRVHGDSRQCYLPVFHPRDPSFIGGKKRVPCTLGYQFIIRNGKMHIIYSQRSADVFLHFGNDIWLAWELMEYVAEMVGVEPGFLYHNIASLHSYRRDWEGLKTCIDQLYEQG